MNDPCILCGDRYCCRGLCITKKKWWDNLEDHDHDLYVPGKRIGRKKSKKVDVNKNGIRRE